MSVPAARSLAARIRPRLYRGALLVSALVGGIMAGVLVLRLRPDSPPLPLIGGQPESCLSCHDQMTGFAPAHEPAAIGCAACHLGNRLARDAEGAHAGMTRTPGNLSLVSQTCATAGCHGDIGERVKHSLMNTMSGVVAVDKHVFGENPDLNRPYVISQIGHSPADIHLRTLCASCHLGNDKLVPGPQHELSRGGGCSACHLDYGARAREELVRRDKPGLAPLARQAHPMISLQVPDQACFGCHSRSGRISTNYEGWHETLLQDGDVPKTTEARQNHRILADGRVFEKMPADVHFTKGMACTDCHVASEVMGDGRAHAHEENATTVACIDCHEDGAPVTRSMAELDAETQKIVTLRGLIAPGRRFVATASGRAVLPNVFVDAKGTTQLVTRKAGPLLQPKPRTAACAREGTGHASLDCNTCHSAWASQCVSCHTQAEPRTPGWDHLAGKETAGSWLETAGQFFADPPALGVRVESDGGASAARNRVVTVAPGMILTLNQGGKGDAPDTSHRLFAPVSPHTTAGRARDCQSCHASSSALGYGRGQLSYEVTGATGRWQFVPEMAAWPADGLPADAWIGFLQDRTGEVATRTDLRPFTVAEQRRILSVGACLTCHPGDSAVMQRALADFSAAVNRRSDRCVLPVWE
jgi:hypothetical protein